jgi:hypothetical protein
VLGELNVQLDFSTWWSSANDLVAGTSPEVAHSVSYCGAAARPIFR